MKLPKLRRQSAPAKAKSQAKAQAKAQSKALTHAGVERFGIGDLFGEAVRGLAGRPGRLVLTALAVVLGIGSLVTTIGFAQTGARQVEATFDAVAATQGVIKEREDPMMSNGVPLPWDGADRVQRLNGVIAAGSISEVKLNSPRIAAAPVFDPEAPPSVVPGIMAATPGVLETVEGAMTEGRFFTPFHEETSQRVAVLGTEAARLLGVTRVSDQPSVFINDMSFTVVGILGSVKAGHDLLQAVILPQSTARQLLGLEAPEVLRLRLEVGAGPMVAKQAGPALNPNSPQDYDIALPGAASDFRKNLTADVNSLFVVLGLVALLIGALTIAVVTSLSVMERRGEIGLRRALGATQANVAAQFVTETAIVGLLGGLTGAAVGVFGVVGISMAKSWTPVLDFRLVGAAALLGMVTGVLAGLAPAIRAARIEPAAALQEGT
ncbi:MAG: ABC transporter permease [Bifidobacteriaceae bacterium]|jgi:putative ABC transport system permease protein|nr:ABC transporter permease [Bifidobacteriaceae bacterium]